MFLLIHCSDVPHFTASGFGLSLSWAPGEASPPAFLGNRLQVPGAGESVVLRARFAWICAPPNNFLHVQFVFTRKKYIAD